MKAPPAESLRALAKDCWRDDCKGIVRKSVILRYLGDYDRLRCSGKGVPPVMEYVVEHCSVFMRSMTIAAGAYERAIVTGEDRHQKQDLLAWLALTSAYSGVDAMTAAICALVLGKTFPENETPGMGQLERVLKGHPMKAHFDRLKQAAWYQSLWVARNRVVHRGFWPFEHRDGWSLTQGPDWHTTDPKAGFSAGPLNLRLLEPFDFQGIIYGLLFELESWELSIRADLKRFESFKPHRQRPVTHFTCLDWKSRDFPRHGILVEFPRSERSSWIRYL